IAYIIERGGKAGSNGQRRAASRAQARRINEGDTGLGAEKFHRCASAARDSRYSKLSSPALSFFPHIFAGPRFRRDERIALAIRSAKNSNAVRWRPGSRGTLERGRRSLALPDKRNRRRARWRRPRRTIEPARRS